jgi:hypothetical protein
MAGIVGALLGSRTAARTAERIADRTAATNERLEARRWADEMWRWNHERRERAYTALLEARDRHVQAVQDDRQPDTELEHAYAQVQLFGSEAANQTAVTWVDVIRYYTIIKDEDRRVAPGEAGSPDVELMAREVSETASREAEQRQEFLDLVRRELKIDDP